MELHAPDAVCPVPHAESQPLPPGHPPVQEAKPSSLQPPTGEHCIFFRQPEEKLTEVEDVPTPDAADVDAAQQAVSPDYLLVLASRTSALAVCQAEHVQAMLEARYGESSPVFAKNVPSELQTDVDAIRTRLAEISPDPSALQPFSFPARTMRTAGDVNLRSPLYVIGGEGRAIWTKELEVALAAGGVDAIVHSLKDVPTTLPKNLELAAILEREDPRDALVVKADLPYTSLDEMPKGSVIGTSSVRRVALLRRAYPHLMFSDVVRLPTHPAWQYPDAPRQARRRPRTVHGACPRGSGPQAHGPRRTHHVLSHGARHAPRRRPRLARRRGAYAAKLAARRACAAPNSKHRRLACDVAVLCRARAAAPHGRRVLDSPGCRYLV